MIKETMTIHEALAEVKMLDAKITAHTTADKFAEVSKTAAKKIGNMTKDDFVKQISENIQSITDLIRRRKAIKNAIAKSNAATTVVIGGNEYTVSEAIEMRNTGIVLKRNLLNKLSSQLEIALEKADTENRRIDEKADLYVTGLFSSKEKVASSETEAVRKAYIDANTVEVIAPKNINEIIKQLSEEVETFEAQVDSKLSIANAVTTIDIEY